MPAKLVTAPVFLISLAWIALGHFLDFENYGQVADPYERVLLLVAVQFVAFAPPALAYFSLRRWLQPTRLVALLLVSLVLGAALRSYALYRGLDLIGVVPPNESAVRVVASIVNVALAMVIVWAGFSAAESHRRRRHRLQEERDQVLRLREQAQAQLDVMDARAAEEIRATLIASVDIQPGDGAEQFSESLRRLIDEVVRPLSRFFQQQSHEWMPPPPASPSLRVDWGVAFRDALTPGRIHPLLIIGIMVWTSVPNTVSNRGAVIAAASVIHLIVLGIPLLFLIRWLGQRVTEGGRPAQGAAAFLVGLYLGGQIIGLTSYAYTRFQEPRFLYAVAAPVYVVIAGTLIAFAQSAMEQSRAMDEALLESTEEVRWSLARARETHRVQRRALAHALHGKVQAALASTILRLETSQTSGTEREALARQMAESLKATIADVDFLYSEAEPLVVVIERIGATWEGVASISTSVDGGLCERLAHDPVCAVAVNDLLTELTFNSIKHGSPSMIRIALRCPTARTLEVTVTDDGRNPLRTQRSGMGTSLLNDCAISWQLTRVGGQTLCVVTLPIQ